MAANYWQSTHSTNWILEREAVEKQSNKKDRQFLTPEEIKKLKIHYSNTIQNLGVKLSIRQRAISTAIVYFRRFYFRNSFVDCEPRLIATTCLYLASKVEECTTQAKKYVLKMREIDSNFPYDMNHILECEFYVLEELDFCLLVFHPYRSLQPYLADLGMEKDCMDQVWSIVNDSYRTDVSLMYPPHIIALAAIFLAGTLLGKDVRPWFAELNVEMKDIWEVIKDILDAYDAWNEITTHSIGQIQAKLTSNVRPPPLMEIK